MARNKIDFPGLVGDGENPHGFRAIEPNGVGHGGIGGDYERQFNWGAGTDGPRWNPSPEPTVFVVGGMAVKPRSNKKR